MARETYSSTSDQGFEIEIDKFRVKFYSIKAQVQPFGQAKKQKGDSAQKEITFDYWERIEVLTVDANGNVSDEADYIEPRKLNHNHVIIHGENKHRFRPVNKITMRVFATSSD